MKNYFLSPIAEQDHDEIVSYLGAENTNAALKLLDSVYQDCSPIEIVRVLSGYRDIMNLLG